MGIQLASVSLEVVLEIPVGIPVVALEEVQAVLVEDQVEALVDLEILATAQEGVFGVVTQAGPAVEVAEMEMAQEAILVLRVHHLVLVGMEAEEVFEMGFRILMRGQCFRKRLLPTLGQAERW